MQKDSFGSYITDSEPEKAQKGYAWYTAIGLQAVDGIRTSDYLAQTAIRNIEGEIGFDEADALIRAYYAENAEHSAEDRTEEADTVSLRIARILSEKGFRFTSDEYIGIHKRLFGGIYDFAGQLRTYNISKKEWVLDGQSVIYGNAYELKNAIEYDIETERHFRYGGLDTDGIIRHLAVFVARLWQIHAFGEGNTRTTAVFFIKYLRYLGYDVNNDSFARNAWYFRNALVRANYYDLKNDICDTTEYLELFLRNLLLNETNELRNRVMHVRYQKQDIQPQKQDIQSQKQDIQPQKQDIGKKLTPHVLLHAEALRKAFPNRTVFGRSDAMKVLGITASPASALLKKLLSAGMIVLAEGYGKGKYLFPQ